MKGKFPAYILLAVMALCCGQNAFAATTPDPVKLGKKVYKTSCALSGCHAGQPVSRFKGMTKMRFNTAVLSIAEMSGVSVAGKNLNNLVKYLRKVK